MIYSVNCICDCKAQIRFENHLRTAIPHRQLSKISWEVMCTRRWMANPLQAVMDKDLWIFAYDDSPFSDSALCNIARMTIKMQNSFFIAYKPNPSEECAERLIENACQKFPDYFTRRELYNHVFLIDSDTHNGFDRLIKAIHNRMSEAKIPQPPMP